MSNNKLSTCCTCGYSWPTGKNGSHQCSAEMQLTIDKLRKELECSLDLTRFMCATWSDIDKWAYNNMSPVELGQYPVIQGTRNQLDLQKIGEQPHDVKNLRRAVIAMLDT